MVTKIADKDTSLTGVTGSQRPLTSGLHKFPAPGSPCE